LHMGVGLRSGIRVSIRGGLQIGHGRVARPINGWPQGDSDGMARPLRRRWAPFFGPLGRVMDEPAIGP